MELKLDTMETIQMYDPKREYRENKERFDIAIHNVLNRGIFINGPEIKQLEESLNKFVNVKHSIAVSNGTDAIQAKRSIQEDFANSYRNPYSQAG